jgi:predicted ribosomally synthesized peptide with SipW-like signal peptide
LKKLIFAVIACVLCAGMVGGAFAYFTDVETSAGNEMGAGTLNIQIGDDNEGYNDLGVTASFNSPIDLEPGQTFTTGPVYLRNTGTMAISEVYARFAGLVESNATDTDIELALADKKDISKYLILQSYEESGDGGLTWYTEVFDEANANAYIDYWNGPTSSGWNPLPGANIPRDGEISLWDLVRVNAFGSGDHLTSLRLFDGGNYPVIPALPAGSAVLVRFTFKLAEGTPNNYQGDTATFSVNFIAAARGVYPDDQLYESGLDGLLTP